MKRLAALLLVVLAASACNVAPSAAEVNGEAIPRTSLYAELNAIASNKAYLASLQAGHVTVLGTGAGTYASSFVSRVLTREVLLKLVAEQDAKRRLRPSATDLKAARTSVLSQVGGAKTYAAFPKSYRSALVSQQAQVTILEDSVTGASPAAIRAYYMAHRSKFPNQSLAKATPAITGQIVSAGASKFQAYFTSLIAHSSITISPRYGHFVSKGANIGVAPPSAPVTPAVTPQLGA
ncbi:MAG: hypothetical protein ACYDH5_17780 [Acidimicrobiales bacterium]